MCLAESVPMATGLLSILHSMMEGNAAGNNIRSLEGNAAGNNTHSHQNKYSYSCFLSFTGILFGLNFVRFSKQSNHMFE